MSQAWETTPEDVNNVIRNRFGKVPNAAMIAKVHNDLDHAAIEKAALYGDDIDQQTTYAYDEIEKQIKENSL